MKNLPAKRDDGIFARIKSFFSNVFGKNKNLMIDEKIKNEKLTTNIINESRNDFLNEFRTVGNQNVMVDDNTNIYDMIRAIEKNPNLLNDVSVQKLKSIERYYDKKIINLIEKDYSLLDELSMDDLKNIEEK